MADLTPSPPSSPPRPGLLRGLRWLLVLSLALNLLVAGLVVGALARHGGPGGRPRPAELSLGPFARALEPEDRREILRSLGGRADLRPPGRVDRAALFAEVVAALRAEPFDHARAAAALAEQSERVAEVERAVQEALLARLAAMTAEERAAFADRLETELLDDHKP